MTALEQRRQTNRVRTRGSTEFKLSPCYRLTEHARRRSSARNIPPSIAEIILAYGKEIDAGEGACRYFLSKESMRRLCREAGRSFADHVDAYRRRNTYVVAARDAVVTVAFSSKPLYP